MSPLVARKTSLAVVALVLCACGGRDISAVDALEGDAADDARAPDAALAIDAASAKELTSLRFLARDNPVLALDASVTISGSVATAEVPLRTDRTHLVATFTTTGVRVEVAGVEQQSGVTVNDFTRPVVYRVFADDGSSADYAVQVSGGQEAYVKASNNGYQDNFGISVALSGDGNTLAVGADEEDSGATGINGNQNDESGGSSGAVYVFSRTGTTWAQQAYVKASNYAGFLGYHVALSTDGDTLVAAAPAESSGATGVNGNQLNTSAFQSGAVYVFTRSGTTWSQQAYVKASNTDESDLFGEGLAISGDGHTLAVGARGEASDATGVDGNQTDNSDGAAGAVYLYTLTGTNWSQQAYIKASNTQYFDFFGARVALSSDGNTLAASAWLEDSAATGIDGDQADNNAMNAGAVYMFSRAGTTWSQDAYIKPSNTDAGDDFGTSMSISGDGNTLVVGAPDEDSNATGIDGNQTDNSAIGSGAVYVFSRSGSTWTQDAYIKGSNTEAGDSFGGSVALSSDGNSLAVGADLEASNATGVDGDQTDNTKFYSGATYLFTRSGSTWAQQLYVKASNTDENDNFGISVAVSSDGDTLACGAWDEASAASGINGVQNDNIAFGSGAVYVYH